MSSASLELGANLSGSQVKSGDDVYLECLMEANPKPEFIMWEKNVGVESF